MIAHDITRFNVFIAYRALMILIKMKGLRLNMKFLCPQPIL